jgi:hypothetical protein
MTILVVASFVFTVVVGAFVWFYWVAAFPCILLKSKLEFQKICDETRLAAREGKIPSESRGFIELQYFLDLERRAVSYPELLATGPLRKPTDSDLEELERRIDAIKQASPEIYEGFTRSQRWILALWFASRPSWLFLHGLLLALGLFWDWAAKAADREKKEAFAVASGLPPIDELCVFSTAAAR